MNLYKKDNKVFTKVKIQKGFPILEFKGKIVDSSKLDLLSRLEISNKQSIGLSGDLDDYVNHSCNPNCKVVVIAKRAFLYTIKQLNSNDEITFDYSTVMLEGEFNCLCKFSECRKVIKPLNKLDSEIIKKYKERDIVPNFILKELNGK